ncbi:MAG: response regulator [Actinomycetota bacterium]|nr:response regulator [Actinomycetota bacterium]
MPSGITRVLVVEEDAESAVSLTSRLRRHGYDAESVGTGSEALSTYHQADLVLLDPDLSDLDGLEVCRLIRNVCNVPIIEPPHSDQIVR